MADIEAGLRKVLVGDVVESLIRFGLIAILLVLCLRYFSPFADLVVWALVLAIALSPIHISLAKKLGNKMGRAATIIVLIAIVGIGAPTVMMGLSFIEPVNQLQSSIQQGDLTIPPPDSSVADWPVIGNKVYGIWHEAANNLSEFLQNNKDTIKGLLHKLIGIFTGTLGAVFLMMGALIIAGIMMAYTESASHAFDRIFSRITNAKKGPELKHLCVATVRSVALGVVGVAFIQAMILGVGFVWAGFATAGLLMLVVFFIGILQLPALLVSIPAIAVLWAGDPETGHATMVTVYLVVGGFADNILKPLLLGRGVDVPMVVILIGALGGMVVSGLLGLFVGGVVLAVGYQLFMEWVDSQDESTEPLAESENYAARKFEKRLTE